MVYIHPKECIDCDACIPECPVEAIYLEDIVPDECEQFIEINARRADECQLLTEILQNSTY